MTNNLHHNTSTYLHRTIHIKFITTIKIIGSNHTAFLPAQSSPIQRKRKSNKNKTEYKIKKNISLSFQKENEQ
jgi:hypothetical protein